MLRRSLTIVTLAAGLLLPLSATAAAAAAEPSAAGGDCQPGSVRCLPPSQPPRPIAPGIPVVPGAGSTTPPPGGASAPGAPAAPTDSDDGQYAVPLPDGTSPHPLTAYHVYFSTGDINPIPGQIGPKVPDPVKSALGLLTEITFTIAKNLVALAVWFLSWASSFWFAAKLAGPATALSQAWGSSLIGPAGLATAAMVLTGFYLVFSFFRGRTAHGYGETIVSVLLAALAVFAVPTTIYNLSMNTAAKTSGVLLVSFTGGNADTIPAPDAGSSFQADGYAQYFAVYGKRLVDKYVGEPAAILSYGQVPKGKCAELHTQILNERLGADDDKVRDIMGSDPDCKKLADQTSSVSADKLAAAALHILACLVILIVVIMVAGPVLVAQVAIAALVIAMPFALLAGATPQFRGWLHRWALALVGSVAAVALSSGLLGLLVWIGDIVTRALAAENASLFLRTAPYALPAIACLIFYRKLRRGLAHGMDRLRDKAANARVGGGSVGGWAGQPATPGALLGRPAVADTWKQAGTVKGQIHRGKATVAGDRKSGRPGLILGAPPKKKGGVPAIDGTATASGSLGALVAGTAELSRDPETGMPMIKTVTEEKTTKITQPQVTRKALPGATAPVVDENSVTARRRAAAAARFPNATTNGNGKGRKKGRGGGGGEMEQRRGGGRTITEKTTTTTRPVTGRAALGVSVADADQRRGLVAARLADGRLGRVVVKTKRAADKGARIAGDLSVRSAARDAEAAGLAAAAVARRRDQAQAATRKVAVAVRDPKAAAGRAATGTADRARRHAAAARDSYDRGRHHGIASDKHRTNGDDKS